MFVTTTLVVGSAVLIAAAGVAKIARPDPATTALLAAGFPANRQIVSGLGVAELAIGTSALIWSSPVTSILVGVAYGGFAFFTFRLLQRQGSTTSCGCFGAKSAVVHPVHVIINSGIALGTALAVAFPPTSLADLVTNAGGHAGILVAACCVAVAIYLTLTSLPTYLTSKNATPPRPLDEDAADSLGIHHGAT